MATKVKPTRLNVTGTPQAGDVPMYVDADSFEWGAGGGGSGDVVGPASSTDGHLAVFDGATGKIIKDGGSVPTSFSPDSAGTQGQVLTKGASGYDWATVSGGDVQVSTDTGNLLTTGVKLWLGDKADFDNLGTLDSNTIYAPITGIAQPRTPGVNTLAYYPLTSTTTLTDESSNSYDLTNNNSVTFGTYQGVDCANFSGDNNNFLKQTSLSYSGGSITMSAWGYSVARNYTYGDEGFVRFGPNFGCYVGWSNRLLVCSPGGIGTVTWVSESGWKLVTVTYDGTDMKLYVNGVLDASNQPTIPTGSGLAIGNISSSGNNSNVWKGGISDVIIESTAWSAQDVADYYNLTCSTYGLTPIS